MRHTPLDEFSIIVYLCAFYVLAAFTYRRPIFGLAGLILIEPFALYRDVGATTLTLPKVAIAAVAVGLLLRRPAIRALAGGAAKPLLLSASAVIAATALTYFEAQFKAPVVRETLKALEYLVVFALAFLCYRTDPDERILRFVFFAVALIVSALAITQEFTTAPAGMWIANHAVPRIAGPLEGPNQLAGYLGLLLPVLIALAAPRGVNILEGTIIFITVCAEMLTLSRSGVVSAFIGVAVTLYVLRAKTSRYYAAGLLLPVLAGLAAVVLVGGEISHFWSADSQFQPSGLGTRSQLWEGAYRLWIAHPLLGIGAGNYEFELGSVGFAGIHTHANSGYIQAAVEGGIPLLLAVLAMTWFSVLTFARRPAAGFVAGALGAAAGMAFHEIFDYLLFYPKIGVLFWVLLGVGAAVLTDRTPAVSRAPEETEIDTGMARAAGPL